VLSIGREIREGQMKRNSGARTARDGDVLVIVDVQNDFCPGGALAVPDGHAVIPVINRLAAQFAHVVLTQDWHPPGHTSFASSHPGKRPFETIEAIYGQQVLWPDHCVQGTEGAAFPPVLRSGMPSWFCAKAFGRRSIPIRRFGRTTGARPPGSRPICASAALSV
jgi:hypothetical protein